MKENIRLTRLASCAGCGAKVGAGMLSKLLKGFETHYDPKLLVGYDTSDDASVYVINESTAIVQTTDFFPPIADDPFLYGQIAAANALSDVYAMGAEPKLALNIMCLADGMDKETVQEILRGGYSKAYEAGVIISGGHTINSGEPVYGLAVTGFVHPERVLRNVGARPGDRLILTKPLGIGVLTTAAKADMVEKPVMAKVYAQMTELNRYARDVMTGYEVHACTDVTGFALLGHGLEMAQGSGCSIYLEAAAIPYHREAYELASMGFVPAGAYRNREFAGPGVWAAEGVTRAMMDILYDPQTSGGLLISLPEADAADCLAKLKAELEYAEIIGCVGQQAEYSIYIE